MRIWNRGREGDSDLEQELLYYEPDESVVDVFSFVASFCNVTNNPDNPALLLLFSGSLVLFFGEGVVEEGLEAGRDAAGVGEGTRMGAGRGFDGEAAGVEVDPEIEADPKLAPEPEGVAAETELDPKKVFGTSLPSLTNSFTSISSAKFVST